MRPKSKAEGPVRVALIGRTQLPFQWRHSNCVHKIEKTETIVKIEPNRRTSGKLDHPTDAEAPRRSSHRSQDVPRSVQMVPVATTTDGSLLNNTGRDTNAGSLQSDDPADSRGLQALKGASPTRIAAVEMTGVYSSARFKRPLASSRFSIRERFTVCIVAFTESRCIPI